MSVGGMSNNNLTDTTQTQYFGPTTTETERAATQNAMAAGTNGSAPAQQQMLTNPGENTSIAQTAVNSTQFVSRNTTEATDPKTKAADNVNQDREEAADRISPDTQRAITRASISHDKPINLNSADPMAADRGIN